MLGNIAVGMTLDSVEFSRGMTQARVEVRSFATDIDRTAGLVKGLFTGFAVGAAVRGLVGMAQEAARAQEGINTLGVTFGDQAKQVETFARRMSSAYNLGLNSMLDAQNQVGGLFQGAGFKPAEIRRYSEGLTKIIVDMQSLRSELSFEDVKGKFLSGLTGEQEPLRALGIVFNEDTIKAKALTMGMGGLGRELSEQEKIHARYAFFVDRTAMAMGNAAVEADGAAAKFASLSGAWENFNIAIGETVAQPIAEVFGALTIGLKAAEELVKGIKDDSTSWLTTMTSELGVATTGMGGLAEAIGLVGDSIQAAHVAWLDWQWAGAKGSSGVFKTIGDLIGDKKPSGGESSGLFSMLLPILSTAPGGMLPLMATGGMLKQKGAGDFFKAWGEEADVVAKKNAKRRANVMLQGRFSNKFADIQKRLQAERAALAAKPPELPAAPVKAPATTFLTRTLDPMGFDAARGMMAAGVPGMGGFAGIGAIVAAAGGIAARVAADPKGRPGFSSAMEAGSREATETILRTRYGSGAKGAAEKDARKTAENTTKTVDVLKMVDDKLGKLIGMPGAAVVDL